MNIFYVEPEKVTESQFVLEGQEAQHASKVLRLRIGDKIVAVNGKGQRFAGDIQMIGRNSLTASIKQKDEIPKPIQEKVLAMGIIKKRDRLEFAVEKAVELGATKIILFNADHSEKEKLRMDRLQTIAISAMKQSMRRWLTEIIHSTSLDAVYEQYPDHTILMAHEETGYSSSEADELNNIISSNENLLLVIGPEGGFSENEVKSTRQRNGKMISLGKYRLRAETAAIAFLSRFL